MEHDNDRKILPPHKTEIFCWIVLALLCPVINAVTFFWFDAIFWPVLFITSLITLPVYFFYSRMMVAQLLFNKKYIAFAFASVAFFIFVQFILLGINSLILQFPLSLPQQFYLASSPRAVSYTHLTLPTILRV